MQDPDSSAMAASSFAPSAPLKFHMVLAAAAAAGNDSVHSHNSCLPTSVWKWVGVFVYPRQVEPQGTLKHCLQISEGLSQGRRIRFAFWHPKGKIDTGIVVMREAEMKITFLDVGGTVVAC